MDEQLLAHLRSRIGTTLRGKWRVDALLGVGGMAAVFAATHRNGHPCAIKMLLPAYSAHGDVTQRFAKEGYVANKVGHPGVVIVLDDDVTEDGAPFLVMELLRGESFDRVLRKGSPVAVAEVMRIAFEVLDVLAAAHAKGIVHRDIKPENVFVLPDGRVKVLDFGIARTADAAPSGRTKAGSVMGTPGYMPPEQARGRWEEVDGQSDVWSVGAMMFVALARRPLRVAETDNEELLQAMSEPCPALGVAAPGVPQAAADVVDRALALDKRSRWPDARAMQRAVGAFLGRAVPGASEPAAVTQMPLDASPLAKDRAATDAVLTAATRPGGQETPPPSSSKRRVTPGRGVAMVATGVALAAVVSLAVRRTGRGPEPSNTGAAAVGADSIGSPPPPSAPLPPAAIAPLPAAAIAPLPSGANAPLSTELAARRGAATAPAPEPESAGAKGHRAAAARARSHDASAGPSSPGAPAAAPPPSPAAPAAASPPSNVDPLSRRL